MNKDIVKHYGMRAQMDITIEECSELITACSNYKRATGDGYRTQVGQEKAKAKVIENMAHVANAIRSLMFLLGVSESQIEEEIRKSDELAGRRLGNGE